MLVCNSLRLHASAFKRLTLIVMAFLVLLIPSFSFARISQNADVLLSSLDKLLAEEPLPKVSHYLPNYHPGAPLVRGAIIADFESVSEDNLAWGASLAEILRHKLACTPGPIILMPSLDYWLNRDDGWQEGMPDQMTLNSNESLRLIARRSGFSNIVRGNINIEGGSFVLTLFLREFDDDSLQRRFQTSGALDDLPQALSTASVWLFNWFAQSPDHSIQEDLSRLTPANYQELQEYTQAITLARAGLYGEADIVLANLATNSSGFPAAARTYLTLTPDGEEIGQHNRRLRIVAERYPQDSGVQLAAIRRFLVGDNKDLAYEQLTRLKGLISSHPNHRQAFLLLNDKLAIHGFNEDAVVVASEILRRWPDYYRSWWSFSYSLLEYAWYVRGNSYYRDVPEKGKRLFAPLMEVARLAVDEALQSHPHLVRLWVHKIRTLGGYDPELMESFEHAIRLAPDDFQAYEKALNFAAPKWGGDLETQIQICYRMVQNNPDASWPYILFTRKVQPGLDLKIWTQALLVYTGGNPANYLLVWLGFSILGILVIGGTVMLVIYVRRK